MPPSPSLQQRLERLSTEQRRQVDALLGTLEQATSAPPLRLRQPGGLLGAMKTHDDFDAPLAEEFLNLAADLRLDS
jgi:hypothetical protein